jgi:DNA-binding Xre family transcriptional regulator
VSERAAVTRREFEALAQRIEDLEDTLYARTVLKETKPEDYLPAELVARLVAGEHPLRIWREHRNLASAELAKRAGMTASSVSDIECGHKPASDHVLQRLAAALKVRVEDIAPVPPSKRPRRSPRRNTRSGRVSR